MTSASDVSAPGMSLPDPIAAGAGLRKWSPLLGPAISLAILAAVLLQLRELNWSMIWSIIPRSPLVWLVLAASYFAAPAADWLIFRRLWNIPAAGFIPLVKKMIGNELLLGYVGEVYFYDWARKHVKMEGSPFGAVKDVAILSALAGNILTLAMLALAWPLIGLLGFGKDGNLMAMSIGIVLLTSLIIMFFRNGLLSLPRDELIYTFVVHCLRVIANTGFAALAWHLILPGVSLGSWLLLATMRLLISRLPLIPNKDIAFAGVATLLVGEHLKIGVMIAMVSMLILATHVILFLALTVLDAVRKEKAA